MPRPSFLESLSLESGFVARVADGLNRTCDCNAGCFHVMATIAALLWERSYSEPIETGHSHDINLIEKISDRKNICTAIFVFLSSVIFHLEFFFLAKGKTGQYTWQSRRVLKEKTKKVMMQLQCAW